MLWINLWSDRNVYKCVCLNKINSMRWKVKNVKIVICVIVWYTLLLVISIVLVLVKKKFKSWLQVSLVSNFIFTSRILIDEELLFILYLQSVIYSYLLFCYLKSAINALVLQWSRNNSTFSHNFPLISVLLSKNNTTRNSTSDLISLHSISKLISSSFSMCKHTKEQGFEIVVNISLWCISYKRKVSSSGTHLKASDLGTRSCLYLLFNV